MPAEPKGLTVSGLVTGAVIFVVVLMMIAGYGIFTLLSLHHPNSESG